MPRTGTKELGFVRSHEYHGDSVAADWGQFEAPWLERCLGAGETTWPMVLGAGFQHIKAWGALSPRIPDVCTRTKAILCPESAVHSAWMVSQAFGSP